VVERRGKGRVLVIDDAENARIVVCGVLQAAGFETEELVSPLGATQLIVNKRIDAVVLDLNMPVMSGARFAELMRRNTLLDHVVLIVVSGESKETLSELEQRISADAVMTKTAVLTMLAPVVDRLIRARSEGHGPPSHPTRGVITTGAVPAGFVLRFEGCEIALPPGAFSIGRGTDSDLVLDDDTVSRHHAVLRVRGNEVHCEDVGSRNGTRVDGKRISGHARIAHAGQITVGPYVFVVEARIGASDGLTRTTRPPPGDTRASAARDRNEVETSVGTTERTLDALAGRVQAELKKGDLQGAAIVLGNLFLCLTEAATSGLKVGESRVASAAALAFTLAGVTQNAEWIEHILELHGALGLVISAAQLDQLRRALPELPTLSRPALRLYVELLRAGSRRLSDDERRRLDVLEALATPRI